MYISFYYLSNESINCNVSLIHIHIIELSIVNTYLCKGVICIVHTYLRQDVICIVNKIFFQLQCITDTYSTPTLNCIDNTYIYMFLCILDMYCSVSLIHILLLLWLTTSNMRGGGDNERRSAGQGTLARRGKLERDTQQLSNRHPCGRRGGTDRLRHKEGAGAGGSDCAVDDCGAVVEWRLAG